MNFNISSLEILNPKLKTSKKGKQVDSALYSYYAGFSEEFTTNLLSQLMQSTPLTVSIHGMEAAQQPFRLINLVTMQSVQI